MQYRATKFAFILILIFSCSLYIYTNPNGVTGRTKKSGNAGCSCHTTSPSTFVSVTITGPDTLIASQTGTYTVTMTGGPGIKGGVDIAASIGTLTAISSSLKRVFGELTHNVPTLFSNGKCEYQFSFTAPAAAGTSTLYATGNSVNGNNGTSGDQWNFSPNKIITILPLTSAGEQYSTPAHFSLSQNYPNPFNPVTVIKYSVYSASHVSLNVYNVNGENVAALVNDENLPGAYEVNFDGNMLPSGAYFYTLQAGQFHQTRKMFLLK